MVKVHGECGSSLPWPARMRAGKVDTQAPSHLAGVVSARSAAPGRVWYWGACRQPMHAQLVVSQMRRGRARLAVHGWDSVMVFLHSMASGFWSCLGRAEPPPVCSCCASARGEARS